MDGVEEDRNDFNAMRHPQATPKGERFKKGFAMNKTKWTPFKSLAVKWVMKKSPKIEKTAEEEK